MNDSDHGKRKDAVVEFLSERPTNLTLRTMGARRTKEEMQHNLARNLLLGFLTLFVVAIIGAYVFDRSFCSNPNVCGDNFVNVKVVIETMLDFGSPFIGIIIGFFFSEKFWNNRKENE
ncbi:MAG TPA: hypothetical protein VK674_05685 [Candidatus Limnocylindria bacterium]|nr:hypothetical protein [Candidatus Limnocylindria bacterium]